MRDINQKLLTCAIIAGGKSKRFEMSKPHAEFQGRTLIDHAICLANSITENIIIIASKEQKLFDRKIKQIPDIIPDCGPMGGIYTALENAQTFWVATLPCDMPLLSTEVYRILLSHKKKGLPVVAEADGKIQSLISIWPKSLSHVLFQSIQKRELKIHQFLTEHQAELVPMEEELENYKPEMFSNINFREDLQNLSRSKP